MSEKRNLKKNLYMYCMYIYVSYSWPNGLTFFEETNEYPGETKATKIFFFFFKIQQVYYNKLIPNLSEEMGRTNCCCFAIRVHFFKESSEAGHHRTPLMFGNWYSKLLFISCSNIKLIYYNFYRVVYMRHPPPFVRTIEFPGFVFHKKYIIGL